MKKNKLVSLLLMGMCAVMLSGCNKGEAQTAIEVEAEEENIFGLTEIEQKMCAEYAAGVLMRYNAGTDMRILEGQALIDQEAKEQAAREQAARREQLAAEYEANKKNNSNKNNSSNSANGSSASSGESSVSYINDMSAATGTDAFSIVYDGYEITDSYPNSGADILMAMDATNGKLLMVTKFKVTNISGQTETFDMFSKQGKFKLELNGKRYKAQYTLLLDDLSMYKGDVESGETIEGVLIFEIPESEASNVNDMVLSVAVDGTSSFMRLKGGSTVMWTETAEDSFEPKDVEDIQDTLEENIQDTEYNDLAEEYMNALENENSGISYEDEHADGNGGNVTVVGSNGN